MNCMKYVFGTFVGLCAICAAYGAYLDHCYYKNQSNK